MTRTASCMIDRARSSTVSGSVALNKDRTIEGFEQAFTTKSICSTKPSSNNLSDSSRTRYSTLHHNERWSKVLIEVSTYFAPRHLFIGSKQEQVVIMTKHACY